MRSAATEAATRIDVAYDLLLTGSCQLFSAEYRQELEIPDELMNRVHMAVDMLEHLHNDFWALIESVPAT